MATVWNSKKLTPSAVPTRHRGCRNRSRRSRWNAKLVTTIVVREGVTAFRIAGFRAYLESRLPRYAVPQHIRTRKSIPITLNGKPNTALLTKEFIADDRHTEETVEEFIRRHTGLDDVPEDTPLNLLGIDSLRFVSLVTQLAPDRAALQDVPLRNTMTVREVRAAVSGTAPEANSVARVATRHHPHPVSRKYGLVTKVSETSIVFGDSVLDHLCSNSYLALGCHADLLRIFDEYTSTGLPWHAHGSPEVNSFTIYHQLVLDAVCGIHRVDAGLLFTSAYLAATTALAGLARAGDQIFVDESAHRSVLDGCVLSGAGVTVYRHNDLDDLTSQLGACASKTARKLIVTEGVFSVEGDIVDLPAIRDLADLHDCLLVVDEACRLDS